MTSSPHILVLGLGSAGKRHWKNLAELGCICSGMDPREDRRDEARQLPGFQNVFPSPEAAFAAGSYDGTVIASPPVFHVLQIRASLQGGAKAVLCEKPLAPQLEALKELPAADNILLGYTYRWWPPIVEMRNRLLRGEIGKIRHVRAVMSAHLEDWHPWERYQDFFMSSANQGGGALLDESHILDLIRWIFGMPGSLFATVEKISDLDISTDDNVDILMHYPDGQRVSIHLDLYARPHERQIVAVGEKGTLRWSYERNAVEVCSTGEQNWQTTPFSCERNEMFVGAAREFLSVLRAEAAPSCTLADGREVLRLVEACRLSQKEERKISLTEIPR